MKKLSIIIVIILVFATVITLGSVSGTYAKYTSEGKATDKAKIAKWHIMLDGNKEFVNDEIEIDMFESVFELDNDENIKMNEIDEDVKPAGPGEKKIIAPGTGGVITIPKIINDSEVTIEYEISLNGGGQASKGIQYSLDKTNWTNTLKQPPGSTNNNNITYKLNELINHETIAPGQTSQTEMKIYWRWLYEGHENQDTKAGTDDPTKTDNLLTKIKVNITATQVD